MRIRHEGKCLSAFSTLPVSGGSWRPFPVLKLILQILGWTLAHTPEPCLRLAAAGLGDLMFYAYPRRRRLVLSNLHHAFPARPAAWRHATGRTCCRRLVETGLWSLAMPFFPEVRLRRLVRCSARLQASFDAHRQAGASASPYPIFLATLHLAYWETQTAMPFTVNGPFPEFGAIFRPLDNPVVDAWVKRTRERFGLRLLSRKSGLQEAMKVLRRQGGVAVLFDQNAGLQGALTTLFGRVCSTSELVGLLVEKFQPRVFATFPHRLDFWRVELDLAPVTHDGTSTGVTLALNRWLEDYLAADDNACASWLWVHDRWRNQDMPARRLRLEAKRNLLADDLRARGLPALPRKTRLWIRVPNWLGDLVLALPLLRAIRASRPDAEITLIGKSQFRELLEQSGVADVVRPLRPAGLQRFIQCWHWRRDYPDCYLLFPTSFRSDLEGWLTRSPQRFGLIRRGRWRPLLTHGWKVPAEFDEAQQHQLQLWEDYLRSFGLAAPPDRSPLAAPRSFGPDEPVVIGLICGSENQPAKRWPVESWRQLIHQLGSRHPELRFRLFGTANDRPVTGAVAQGFASVEDLAGRTDLVAFARALRECSLLVTNDTGGMHLANAFGVPLIALFGPTNPRRTAPVFAAPAEILQPPGCPPTGGAGLEGLPAEMVITAVEARLRAPAPVLAGPVPPST
jgi:heptosyltransferase II